MERICPPGDFRKNSLVTSLSSVSQLSDKWQTSKLFHEYIEELFFPATHNAFQMNIGLFIPCYIDQFYPQVGIATFRLLEKLGCSIEYPLDQTCCGQPMANTGCEKEAIPSYLHFADGL